MIHSKDLNERDLVGLEPDPITFGEWTLIIGLGLLAAGVFAVMALMLLLIG